MQHGQDNEASIRGDLKAFYGTTEDQMARCPTNEMKADFLSAQKQVGPESKLQYLLVGFNTFYLIR